MRKGILSFRQANKGPKSPNSQACKGHVSWVHASSNIHLWLLLEKNMHIALVKCFRVKNTEEYTLPETRYTVEHRTLSFCGVQNFVANTFVIFQFRTPAVKDLFGEYLLSYFQFRTPSDLWVTSWQTFDGHKSSFDAKHIVYVFAMRFSGLYRTWNWRQKCYTSSVHVYRRSRPATKEPVCFVGVNMSEQTIVEYKSF